MKNFIVALMVLTSMVSCGKKNAVGSNGFLSNPITVSTQGAAALGSQIDNYSSQFGTMPVLYYGNQQTLGTLVNTGINIYFKYTKSTSSGSGTSCSTKWGIFYVCTYTSTSSPSSFINSRDPVASNSVNVTEKMNQLKAIINSSNPLIAITGYGTAHMITTMDGKKYIIDTAYPIQANPIAIMDSTGTEYLYTYTDTL